MKKKDPRKNYSTKRLFIRPLMRSDFTSLNEALNRSAKTKTTNRNDELLFKEPISRDLFRKLLFHNKQSALDDRLYVYDVFQKRTAKHIGAIYVSVLARKSIDWANIGYYVHPQFQGQGFGTEMLAGAIPRLHKDLNLFRIEASIDLANKASIKLVKKIGFKKETLRKGFYSSNGERRDCLVFFSLPEFWDRS